VHDIRHTFATRALERAPDQRDRIARHMLAVSTYLGHTCVADTSWYFQTTPTLMSQVADACQRHFEGGRP
jgi:integrase